MAVRDVIARFFGLSAQEHVEFLGPAFRDMVLGLTAEELYRTQPHLRIVLSFVARNVAHLGLHAFERVSETDRARLRDDPLALLMKRPNATMTGYELIETLVSDLGLYDIAYWFVAESTKAPSGWEIRPIPPSWVVEQRGGDAFAAASYVVQNLKGERYEVGANDMIVFHGWNPGRPKHGTSPVQTLKQILAEQVQAWSYRQQVWQRGGRVGTVITRPQGREWSDAARTKFMQAWKARWTGMNGAAAGGTPILEDGMTIQRLGFGAREEEWAEVAKVALSTVAAVYHVNPVMVGILDNANFSNTKEFRKMLYSETLGPQLAMIEDRLNAFLVPRVSKSATAYLEFNIAEKLQGDFEEQAAVLSASTGAPWMTRNEARARQNLPAIEGGDEVVTPLNVLIGGQASPRDGVTAGGGGGSLPADDPEAVGATVDEPKTRQQKAKAATGSVKSSDVDPTEYVAAAQQVLRRFFERQRKAVLSRLGAKDDAWWDAERWDKELGDDLYRLAVTTATSIGTAQAVALGFEAGEYDEDRTLAFLRAVADSRAGAVNAATRAQIAAAIDDEDGDPSAVFDVAVAERADTGSAALVAALAGFAVMEAGKQLVGSRATKTWLVMSSNPRPEHAAMNGETVPIEDDFSNGATWPGDPVLGVDGVAGCSCALEINY